MNNKPRKIKIYRESGEERRETEGDYIGAVTFSVTFETSVAEIEQLHRNPADSWS